MLLSKMSEVAIVLFVRENGSGSEVWQRCPSILLALKRGTEKAVLLMGMLEADGKLNRLCGSCVVLGAERAYTDIILSKVDRHVWWIQDGMCVES